MKKEANGDITVARSDAISLAPPWKYVENIPGQKELQIVTGTGELASVELLQSDANLFAEAFCKDVRLCFAFNQMHRCAESCVKHAKNKLSKKEQVGKNRAPLCRAGFFHIIELAIPSDLGSTKIKRKRRRGKRLQTEPVIDDEPESRTFCRIKCRRDHPFISISSDVAQVCARSNVDVQFLTMFPPLEPTAVDSKLDIPWMTQYGFRTLSSFQQAVAKTLAFTYRGMHNIDFYITKYVAKPLSTLKPLLDQFKQTMLKMEQDKAQLETPPLENQESIKAQAKTTLLKIANAANACQWQSATELATVLMTGGDMLQTHTSHTVFCKQVIYMMHQAKTVLLHEHAETTCEDDLTMDSVHVDLLSVQQAVPDKAPERSTDHCSDAGDNDLGADGNSADQDTEHDVDENQNSPKAKPDEATESDEEKPQNIQETSTNMADDYAHRGPHLKDLNYFVYATFVRRMPLTSTTFNQNLLWPFETHYPLSNTYGQEIRYKMAIPRLCNFNCPSLVQNPEDNAMMKAFLLTPASCPGPERCHHVSRFFPHVGMAADGEPHLLREATKTAKRRFGKKNKIKTHVVRMRQLALEAPQLEDDTQKLLVLHDATLFKTWLPEDEIQKHLECVTTREVVKESLRALKIPDRAIKAIIKSLCCHCIAYQNSMRPHTCCSLHWGHHDEQATVEQIVAHISCNVALSLDLSAEAKQMPRPRLPGEDAKASASDEDCSLRQDAASQFQIQVEPMAQMRLRMIWGICFQINKVYTLFPPQKRLWNLHFARRNSKKQNKLRNVLTNN